jgi:hypothetical protein
MVLVLVISRSNKHYDTLFSIDLKAKKRTITTTYLVAIDSSTPALTSTTTTISLVTIDDGVPANVYLIDSSVPAPAPSPLT